MQELINQTIRKIYIRDGEDFLYFKTDGGVLAYETTGDCCSETWFADITGVEALLNAIVLSCESMAMDDDSLKNYNNEDGRERQDSDQVYGYKLTTNKGYADIIFRNSSNGSGYGGCVKFRPQKFEDSYDNSFFAESYIKEIKEDWHALAPIDSDSNN